MASCTSSKPSGISKGDCDKDADCLNLENGCYHEDPFYLRDF